jgi:uncharacterized membrane protein
MISALLALLASAAFGASDFIAAITSRRISPVAVALWSQLAGAAALLVMLALSGQRPEASGIAWGAASGVVAAVGVLLFYRALAIGPTSVISPVVASGVAIPVLVGVLGGEQPVGGGGRGAASGGGRVGDRIAGKQRRPYGRYAALSRT